MHRIQRHPAPLLLLSLLALSACGEKEAPPRLAAEGSLEVDGAQLRYGTEGSGAPVIILHDGPGIGQAYFVSAFGAPGFPPPGLRWIAYDQRGSGRSTGAEDPSKLTMARFVEDLEAVRKATGEERVALMGHGFGGLLALEYAVAYPERVAAMILLDPDPASHRLWAEHERIVEARTTDEDRMLMAAISGGDGWELDPVQVERYYLVRFQAYFGRREAASGLRLGLAQSVYGNFPKTAEIVRESLGDWDIFDRLSGVTARTLILTGDQSIYPMRAHEMLRDALPNARLVVLPGVGHFPQMEDPEGFAREVDAFLAEITRNVEVDGR
jgi:proline iminopeptidase